MKQIVVNKDILTRRIASRLISRAPAKEMRLTDAQVIDARFRMATYQASLKMLTRKCGVSTSTMGRAITGKSHTHLPGATKIIKTQLYIDFETLKMIRDEVANGVTCSSLVEKYGYSYGLIYKIINRLERYEFI